jgi:uncharacterized protein (TIGR02118 family)
MTHRYAAVLLLAAACTTPKETPKPAADTTAAAAPVAAAPAGPQAIVTVLYKQPKNPAAFEKYYPTHLKIVGDVQAEIGFTKAELTKFSAALDGKKPAFYRQAELYFPSMDALQKGLKSSGMAKVSADFKNFVAPDGLVGMIAEETGEKSDAPCPALVTVLYNTPKDAAAFEAYYPKHLDVVGAGKGEIGFVRADLTKFVSNLDGSAPAMYRQAELCFDSMESLQKGLKTTAFMNVGHDFPNFVAPKGMIGLIGTQQ